jgi:hypothetical protein
MYQVVMKKMDVKIIPNHLINNNPPPLYNQNTILQAQQNLNKIKVLIQILVKIQKYLIVQQPMSSNIN